jgi:hypothetical protein
VRKLLLAGLLPFGCVDAVTVQPHHDAAHEVAFEVAFDTTIDTTDVLESLRDATVDASLDTLRDTAAEAQGDARLSEDVVIDPGSCGPLTRVCLCACGSTVPCQNACIARNDDCAFCIFEAATRCCPDEWRVLDECITRNMCADEPCIQSRCGVDQRRLENCFAAAQVSDESCRAAMRVCLGSDYPMIRCVQP